MLEIKNNSDYGEIYIYGDVTTDSSGLWSYEDVCPSIIVDQIKELKNKPLNIRINSCGGSVFGGIAIYNTLKSYKGYKTVYIDGCACSIASVIAMCADKIVMCKNSYLMIHSAWVGGVQGNAEEMRKVAELLDEMDSTILNIYKTKLKDSYPIEDLQQLIKAESWLKAEECVEIFNDIEIDEETKIEAYAKLDSFNYKNIPSSILNLQEEDEDKEEEEKPCEECEADEEVEKEPIEEEDIEEDDKPQVALKNEEQDKEVCKECHKEPCECDKEEEVEDKVNEPLEEEVEDKKVCETCLHDPCICEEIKRKQEKEEYHDKAIKELAYMKAQEFMKKYK